MTIRLYRDDDRNKWDSYLINTPKATCYHQMGWKEVIEKSFGHTTWYFLSEDRNNRIDGILPLVQLKSALFGNYMVSLPYFNYGGVCADSDEIRNNLMISAVKCANDNNAEHIELRHTQAMDNDWQAKTSKVSMRLEIPQNSDKLWEMFPSKLRSQIQRPLKEGMYAKLGREECLDDFYAIFSINMRDLGTPVYSKAFFRYILRAFPQSTWICTVSTKNRQPVASGFLVGFKDSLEIPWASSLRSYNRYSPNMLLYWSVLKLACDRGYRLFDFGRSTADGGTYRFKAQWGAQPVQLYWHYWLKNGKALPEINPNNPKYQFAIKMWKMLPVSITKVIGPSIVKNLP